MEKASDIGIRMGQKNTPLLVLAVCYIVTHSLLMKRKECHKI